MTRPRVYYNEWHVGFPDKLMPTDAPFLTNKVPTTQREMSVSCGPRQGVGIAFRLLWDCLGAALRGHSVTFVMHHEERAK